MKKQLPAFLSGVIITTFIFTATPAIAAQIQTITATANTVNIALDGKQVAAKGESYTLDNGTQVPYSLSYNGTTYLPMRKVGELVGKDIYWDQATGTAGVGVDPKAETPLGDNKSTTDYSDWTVEEETAYQEFKGMWEVSVKDIYAYIKYNKQDIQVLKDFLNAHSEPKIKEYCHRLDAETYAQKDYILAIYMYNGETLWDDNYANNYSRCGFEAGCLDRITD